MGFDVDFFLELLPKILAGSLMTVWAALLGSVGAVAFGLALAIGRRSGGVGRVGTICFSEAVRLSPFLVQLYFLYFVLPTWGIVISATAVGVLALSLHYGAFLGEVFDAGLSAVPHGQIEVGNALGMKRWQIMWLVMLPQTLRFVAAPSANHLIGLLKSTPYLATIGVHEMLGSAFDVASDTFRYVEPLTAAGLLFLVFSAIVGSLVRVVETRLRPF
ncbi:MAG: amino acid ABC transporter permease [Xanthobacteraceae bacterium]